MSDPPRNLYLFTRDPGRGLAEGCDVTEVAFVVCSSDCKIQGKKTQQGKRKDDFSK